MSRTRVRWGRLGTVVAVAATAVSVVGGVARAGGASSELRSVDARTYTVRSGDTVWGIAREIVGPTRDPRPLADRIVRENQIDPATLRPGETLVLPGA